MRNDWEAIVRNMPDYFYLDRTDYLNLCKALGIRPWGRGTLSVSKGLVMSRRREPREQGPSEG